MKTRTPPSKAVVENAPIQSLINSCAIRSYRSSFVFQPINSMITANIGTPRIKDPNNRCSCAAIHAALRLPIFGNGRYSASVRSFVSCAKAGTTTHNAKPSSTKPSMRKNLFFVREGATTHSFVSLNCLGGGVPYTFPILQTELYTVAGADMITLRPAIFRFHYPLKHKATFE